MVVRAELSDRDRAVLTLVGRFRQLTAGQIGALLFADRASQTPRDRCLRRLTSRGYLSRLEQRLVGGASGGSAQYVYQLGRQGWHELGQSGRYWTARAVNLHAIELGELFVRLKGLEQAGEVELLRFDVEQEAWCEVGGVQLTPDAYAELGLHASRTKRNYFIELDRGTESLPRIRDKCLRYWHAYRDWERQVFPFVVFVVPDALRQRAIQGVIANGPQEVRRAFAVWPTSQLLFMWPLWDNSSSQAMRTARPEQQNTSGELGRRPG